MVVVEIYDGLRAVEKLEVIGSFYELPNETPFYVKFSPAMLHEGIEIESIHCWGIELEQDGLRILPQNISLKFSRSTTTQKVTLTNPGFQPIPDQLNLIYRSDSFHNIGFYLFTCSGLMGSEPIFRSAAALSPYYKNVSNWIKDQLHAAEGRSGGIKLAVLTGSQTTPEFKDPDEVITVSFMRTCPRLVVILAKPTYPNFTIKIGEISYQSTDIPPYPRMLVEWAMVMLQNCSEPKKRFFRRLIKIGISGGIAIDMLDRIENPTAEESLIRSDNFDKVVLHLCKKSSNMRTLEKSLIVAYHNLRSFNTDLNESTLCAFFWDQVIDHLFILPPTVDHNFEREWPTDRLRLNSPSRRVDFCAMVRLDEGNNNQNQSEILSPSDPTAFTLPVLMVEYGKDDFSYEQQHKDCSKLFEMMASTCISMAYRLVDLQVDPEIARVYGILVGGFRFQLCVARAVVRPEGSMFSIHVEITFRKHWHLSLLRTVSGEEGDNLCREACCRNVRSPETLMESIESAGRESYREVPPELFDEILDQSIDLPLQEEESSNPQATPTLLKQFDLKSLKKLERFFFIVKNRISILENASSSSPRPPRQYLPRNSKVYFSQSSSRTDMQTPQSYRVQKAPRIDDPSSPTSRIRNNGATLIVEKHSLPELNLYKKLSTYYPSYFARIYEVVPRYDESKDEWTISYTFEKLLPLVEFRGYDKRLSNIIWRRSLIASIKAATKLAIDVLFELHLLHKQLGMIHCDLSFGNIMFSEEDCIWKIIDFNLSKPVDECLRVRKFRGGTEPFIAPECKSQGFYSEASDIFSLGSVISHAFLDTVTGVNEKDSLEGKLVVEYSDIIHQMVEFDAKSRPTVLEALDSFLRLLRKIVPDPNDPIYNEQVIKSAKMAVTTIENNPADSTIESHKKDVLHLSEGKDINNMSNIVRL